jgi:Mlc titration factor MtfA (ptsG expression regulator)
MRFPWTLNRKVVRSTPFPERWLAWLSVNMPQYGTLTEAEQEVLRGSIRRFIAEKYWEGCGGLVLTDEIKLTIAAQACLLILNLPQNSYRNVRSILVYPSGYRAKMRVVGPDGVVTEGMSHRLGEAWRDGPVILSWEDARAGGADPTDGRNVVFHEFAHKLDMGDGAVDGTPRLHEDAAYQRWFEVMSAEYQRLVADAEAGRTGVLDPYGAEDAGELFAVATEVFFERPRELRDHHPQLYQVLAEYYRQDPALRVPIP